MDERSAYMVSKAIKEVGYNADSVIALIYEDMYSDDADEFCRFIRHVCENKIPVTERTMKEVFIDWKYPEDVD